MIVTLFTLWLADTRASAVPPAATAFSPEMNADVSEFAISISCLCLPVRYVSTPSGALCIPTRPP